MYGDRRKRRRLINQRDDREATFESDNDLEQDNDNLDAETTTNDVNHVTQNTEQTAETPQWRQTDTGLQQYGDTNTYFDASAQKYVTKQGEYYWYLDENGQAVNPPYFYDYENKQFKQYVAEDTTHESIETIPQDQADNWLKENGYKAKGMDNKRVIISLIDGFWIGGSKEDAYNLFKNWNAAHPDDAEKKLSLEEAGINIEAVEREIAANQERERLEAEEAQAREERNAPREQTFRLAGKNVETELFSKEGGFHNIYKIKDSVEELGLGAANANILVRVPKPGTQGDIVRQGMQNYRELKGIEGVQLPVIYNNPIKEGFYLVEKIPNAYDGAQMAQIADPASNVSLQNVKKILDINVSTVFNELSGGQVSTEPVPDFRPDNIMLRDNGQPVYIDFSEPSEQWQSRDIRRFVATYKDFIEQFAGKDVQKGSKKSTIVYNYLISDMPDGFKKLLTDPHIDQELFH